MSARERMADRIAVPHWGALLNHNGKDSNQEQWSPEMHRWADWTGTKRLLWGTVCVYGWSSVLLNYLMFIQVFWPFLDRLGCPRSVFVPLVDYNKLIVLDKKRQRNLPGHQTKNEKWVYSGIILAEPYPKPRQWTTAVCSSLIFLVRKTDPQRPVWNCCSPRQGGWGMVGGGGGKPCSSGLIPHQQQHHQNSVPISKPWFTWKETRDLQRNGH